MNRSKAPLALMGQLLMVLFFALAAAICLQAFAKSETISQSSADRDAASLLAQNAAETLKSVHGDLDAASALLGGKLEDGIWRARGDSSGCFLADGAYHLEVRPVKTDGPGLGKAKILVTDGAEKELFSLICSWQEGLE